MKKILMITSMLIYALSLAGEVHQEIKLNQSDFQTVPEDLSAPLVKTDEYIISNHHTFSNLKAIAGPCIIVVIYDPRTTLTAMAHFSGASHVPTTMEKLLHEFFAHSIPTQRIKVGMVGGLIGTSEDILSAIEASLTYYGLNTSLGTAVILSNYWRYSYAVQFDMRLGDLFYFEPTRNAISRRQCPLSNASPYGALLNKNCHSL